MSEAASTPPPAALIIVAGGRGTRMASALPKPFLELMPGEPILVHTLHAFAGLDWIAQRILVLGPDSHAALYGDHASREAQRYRSLPGAPDAEALRAQLDELGVSHACIGGARRQDSVANGFALVDHAATPIVLVHDGVRPFPESAAIAQAARDAHEHGAAVLAVPLKDTIKRINAEGCAIETPKRSDFVAVQTPQALRASVLAAGFDRFGEHDVTDDVSFAEMQGFPVKLVDGSYTNLKITTPEDMDQARRIIAARATPTG